MRDPAVADLAAGSYRELRSRFSDLARRAQAAGQVPANVDSEQLGALRFGLAPGYILQRLLLGDIDPEPTAPACALLRSRGVT